MPVRQPASVVPTSATLFFFFFFSEALTDVLAYWRAVKQFLDGTAKGRKLDKVWALLANPEDMNVLFAK